ncbi:MAG: antioxidant AhpC [Methylophaga sp.]|nr:MAG: antioxidant AhpC [Methylophaga sp.]
MKAHNRHALFAISLLAGLFLINWLDDDSLRSLPDLAFVDIDGKQHTFNQYKGNPILVTFWATDCPGCIKEMPDLIHLYNTYASQGLTMIDIALAHDSPNHIKAMRAERKLPFVISWDSDGSLARAFDNVRVTPTHFLINPKGDIVMRKLGGLNTERLYKHLQNMGLSIIN